ncbi:lysoplasmalogenase [Nocardioides mesophilus]|uniref:Lysoplasmalogenase n=1 Tax=Nocardioides mesophilus TaxID=433659 RepID=A0A7G9R9K7_9ACTN|nr:lysoplasmalogenase [Nocardioides mesophilus]QNN52282.1 lysoplasmalogenase [Nocardioides mesophilus]
MPRKPALATAASSSVYVALAATDTYLAGRPGAAARRARFLVKPALMPALSTAFVTATRGRRSALARGTAAAQFCSWAGDTALLGRSEPAFLTGVGSFAAAHVAYGTAFTSVRGPRRPTGLREAGALWATTAPLITLAARRREPRLAGPVAGYATIISAMFASSTMLGPQLPASSRASIQAGTGLFLLSDTLLGIQKFLLPQPSARLERAVMATYTLGQGLIALGVATVPENE